MKRLLSLLLCMILLVTTCSSFGENVSQGVLTNDVVLSLDDPNLLTELEGTLYLDLLDALDSYEYCVEELRVIYLSQEYLEELEFNSQANVYFGFTAAEINAQFHGTRYVFTLSDDGKTQAQPFEDYVDPYQAIIKNIAVGTGVILVRITVSLVSAGAGAPAVSLIFSCAAKGAHVGSLTSAAFGGGVAGLIKLFQTGNINDAVEAAAFSGSNSYKWGAIIGATSNGLGELGNLYKGTRYGLPMNDVAVIQKESHYPIDVIRQFHSFEEYQIFQDAQLFPLMINHNLALVRHDIDLTLLDNFGRTNLERMTMGLSPLDANGFPFELHHIGQKANATLAILTRTEHDDPLLHSLIHDSEIDRVEFAAARKAFWKSMAEILKAIKLSPRHH